jgi:Tfp pilus assembly protein PilW
MVRHRRGLSLPEAMISLAITAMLLVAVAAAFSSSCQAIEMNDSWFRCTQAARVTLSQMLVEIRNCDSLQISPATAPYTTISIIRPSFLAGSNQLLYRVVGPPSEVSRSFTYNSTAQQITLQISFSDGSVSPVYVLASNVTNCQISYVAGKDYNNASIPVQIALMLTVSTGGNTIELNGAAAPRRAIKY